MALRMTAVSALAVGATAVAVTPVEKVIDLLHDMRANLEDESNAEAHTYDEFACYCKDTTMQKSDNIRAGQTNIDTLSADLVEATATKADREKQLGENKVKLGDLQTKLKETEVRCAKEKAAYETKDADLSKAISSLENAKMSMESSKQGSAAAMITMQRVIKSNPSIESALKTLEAGPNWSRGAAFLQQKQKAKVDPNDPDYKYHSQEIIDLLQKLHEEFVKDKEDRDAEEAKREQACDDLKVDLAHEIELTEGTIMDLETEIGDLTAHIADTRSMLVEENNLLKDDKLYLTDLTEICEKRANQWDQRSAMRADELKALTGALDLLEGSVAGADASVNKRALLQRQAVKPLSFVQESKEVHAHASVQQHASAQQVELRMKTALQTLREAGKRLHSVSIMSLVSHSGSDPFAKVKGLIQKLVERLIAEATAEAGKKGFCDTELGKAKTQRGFRLEEVNKLSGEIGNLETKNDALELELEELAKALADLKLSAEEAAALRAEQKEQNTATLKEAREGLAALTEAIGILKQFYKQAAKAASLVQAKASPIEEDNPGAGFSGSYKGNQAGATGVIGLLEVIKTDFEHTITVTTETEKQQQADYVEFDRVTQADIGAKTTKEELDTADLKTTKLNLEAKTQEMKNNMDLLDDALKEIEDLKPTCIDNVMSYAERVAKREEEIEALKKALCQLDGEGIEEMCQ